MDVDSPSKKLKNQQKTSISSLNMIPEREKPVEMKTKNLTQKITNSGNNTGIHTPRESINQKEKRKSVISSKIQTPKKENQVESNNKDSPINKTKIKKRNTMMNYPIENKLQNPEKEKGREKKMSIQMNYESNLRMSISKKTEKKKEVVKKPDMHLLKDFSEKRRKEQERLAAIEREKMLERLRLWKLEHPDEEFNEEVEINESIIDSDIQNDEDRCKNYENQLNDIENEKLKDKNAKILTENSTQTIINQNDFGDVNRLSYIMNTNIEEINEFDSNQEDSDHMIENKKQLIKMNFLVKGTKGDVKSTSKSLNLLVVGTDTKDQEMQSCIQQNQNNSQNEQNIKIFPVNNSRATPIIKNEKLKKNRIHNNSQNNFVYPVWKRKDRNDINRTKSAGIKELNLLILKKDDLKNQSMTKDLNGSAMKELDKKNKIKENYSSNEIDSLSKNLRSYIYKIDVSNKKEGIKMNDKSLSNSNCKLYEKDHYSASIMSSRSEKKNLQEFKVIDKMRDMKKKLNFSKKKGIDNVPNRDTNDIQYSQR